MDKKRQRPAAVRVFIEEWMSTRDIPNQKALAKRMARAEGTISKKLARPSKIDLQWLAEFANALRVEVTDLFRDPADLPSSPTEYDPQLAKLMRVAASLTEVELEQLISILARGQSVPPPEQLEIEDQPERSSTAQSA